MADLRRQMIERAASGGGRSGISKEASAALARAIAAEYRPEQEQPGFLDTDGPLGFLQIPLNVIDTPRRLVTGVAHELVDLAQGEGFSPTDLFEHVDKGRGFGEVVENLGGTGNDWVDRALGFLGDVALDPLTYVGGIGVATRGSRAIATGASSTADTVRRAAGFMGDDAAKLVDDMADDDILRLWSTRGTQNAAERGARDPVLDAVFARADEAIANVANPRIRASGLNASDAEILGVRQGLYFRLPQFRRLAERGGGPALQVAGAKQAEMLARPFRSASAKFWDARLGGWASKKFNSDLTHLANVAFRSGDANKVTKALRFSQGANQVRRFVQASQEQAVYETDAALRRLGKDPGLQDDFWVRYLAPEGSPEQAAAIQRLRAAGYTEADEMRFRTAMDKMWQHASDAGVPAADGGKLRFFENMVPERLTTGGRAAVQAFESAGKTVDAAAAPTPASFTGRPAEFQYSKNVDDKFLGRTLEGVRNSDGTINRAARRTEMERIAREEFGIDLKLWENDPIRVAQMYAAEVYRQVYEVQLARLLQDTGFGGSVAAMAAGDEIKSLAKVIRKTSGETSALLAKVAEAQTALDKATIVAGNAASTAADVKGMRRARYINRLRAQLLDAVNAARAQADSAGLDEATRRQFDDLLGLIEDGAQDSRVRTRVGLLLASKRGAFSAKWIEDYDRLVARQDELLKELTDEFGEDFLALDPEEQMARVIGRGNNVKVAMAIQDLLPKLMTDLYGGARYRYYAVQDADQMLTQNAGSARFEQVGRFPEGIRSDGDFIATDPRARMEVEQGIWNPNRRFSEDEIQSMRLGLAPDSDSRTFRGATVVPEGRKAAADVHRNRPTKPGGGTGGGPVPFLEPDADTVALSRSIDEVIADEQRFVDMSTPEAAQARLDEIEIELKAIDEQTTSVVYDPAARKKLVELLDEFDDLEGKTDKVSNQRRVKIEKELEEVRKKLETPVAIAGGQEAALAGGTKARVRRMTSQEAEEYRELFETELRRLNESLTVDAMLDPAVKANIASWDFATASEEYFIYFDEVLELEARRAARLPDGFVSRVAQDWAELRRLRGRLDEMRDPQATTFDEYYGLTDDLADGMGDDALDLVDDGLESPEFLDADLDRVAAREDLEDLLDAREAGGEVAAGLSYGGGMHLDDTMAEVLSDYRALQLKMATEYGWWAKFMDEVERARVSADWVAEDGTRVWDVNAPLKPGEPRGGRRRRLQTQGAALAGRDPDNLSKLDWRLEWAKSALSPDRKLKTAARKGPKPKTSKSNDPGKASEFAMGPSFFTKQFRNLRDDLRSDRLSELNLRRKQLSAERSRLKGFAEKRAKHRKTLADAADGKKKADVKYAREFGRALALGEDVVIGGVTVFIPKRLEDLLKSIRKYPLTSAERVAILGNYRTLLQRTVRAMEETMAHPTAARYLGAGKVAAGPQMKRLQRLADLNDEFAQVSARIAKAEARAEQEFARARSGPAALPASAEEVASIVGSGSKRSTSALTRAVGATSGVYGDTVNQRLVARSRDAAKAEAAKAQDRVVGLEDTLASLDRKIGGNEKLIDRHAMEMLNLVQVKEMQEALHEQAGAVVRIAAGGNEVYTTQELAEALAETVKFAKLPHFVSKYYSPALAYWRGWVLLSPGFHLRNLMGGLFNNWLADVPLRYNRRALAASLLYRGQLTDNKAMITTARAIGGDGKRLARDAKYLGEVLENGWLRGGMYQVEQGRMANASWAPWRNNFGPLVASQHFGEGVEVAMRYAMFLHAVESAPKGAVRAGKVGNPIAGARVPMTAEGHAAEMVTKFHFDYDDLNQFEKKLKLVIPFYVWTRRNVPLQLEMMLRRPAKINRVTSFQRNLEAGTNPDGDERPNWFDARWPTKLPFEIGGLPTYLMGDLPFREAGEASRFLANPREALGSVSPYLKAVPEFFLGMDIERGQQVDYDVAMPAAWRAIVPLYVALQGVGAVSEDDKGREVIDGNWARAIEANLPLLARLRRLFPSESSYQERATSSWLGFLGLPVRQLTEADERYARLEASREPNAAARRAGGAGTSGSSGRPQGGSGGDLNIPFTVATDPSSSLFPGGR